MKLPETSNPLRHPLTCRVSWLSKSLTSLPAPIAVAAPWEENEAEKVNYKKSFTARRKRTEKCMQTNWSWFLTLAQSIEATRRAVMSTANPLSCSRLIWISSSFGCQHLCLCSLEAFKAWFDVNLGLIIDPVSLDVPLRIHSSFLRQHTSAAKISLLSSLSGLAELGRKVSQPAEIDDKLIYWFANRQTLHRPLPLPASRHDSLGWLTNSQHFWTSSAQQNSLSSSLTLTWLRPVPMGLVFVEMPFEHWKRSIQRSFSVDMLIKHCLDWVLCALNSFIGELTNENAF